MFLSKHCGNRSTSRIDKNIDIIERAKVSGKLSIPKAMSFPSAYIFTGYTSWCRTSTDSRFPVAVTLYARSRPQLRFRKSKERYSRPIAIRSSHTRVYSIKSRETSTNENFSQTLNFIWITVWVIYYLLCSQTCWRFYRYNFSSFLFFFYFNKRKADWINLN